MIVTLAALICFGFYLANIPLKCALVFTSHPQAAIGRGVAIFEGRFALRRALRRKKVGGRFSLPDPVLLRPTLGAAKYLLRRIHIERLCLRGIVSTDDAASTAILAGLGNLISSASFPFGGIVLVELYPDFSARGSDVELTGMIAAKLGHIILAALIFAFEYGKERYQKWKAGIPLRALCRPPLKTSAT